MYFHDFEIVTLADNRTKGTFGVASIVTEKPIVCGEEPVECRSGNEDVSLRRQMSRCFGKNTGVVSNVLQNVHHQNDVKQDVARPRRQDFD